MKMSIENGPNFGPTMGFSTSSQGALCQAVSAPKMITETQHQPYSRFCSNDFWLFPNVKCTVKGRRFQDIEHIQKKKKRKKKTTALKFIPQQEFQKCL
jgi:hypothetical protein